MSVNNISKILQYIYPVTKQEIEFEGKTYDPVKKVVLRKSLFYQDYCNLCGKCCIAEDNIFLPFEVENMYYALKSRDIDTSIHKLNNRAYINIDNCIDSLKPFYVTINSTEYKLFRSSMPPNEYIFEDRGTLKRCHWNLPTEDGRLGCGIHTVSSLTCKMPHIRFLHNKKLNATYIMTAQYGRNWALKCPVKFVANFNLNRVEEVIGKFNLLQQYCEYFNINTYVPKILDLLRTVKCENDAGKICDINIVEYQNTKVRKLFYGV